MWMTRENELMSRHARQMSITESSKQALFTRVLDDGYGNYRINCIYAHAREMSVAQNDCYYTYYYLSV